MRYALLFLLLAACETGDPPTESQAEAEALNEAADALDAQTLPPPVLVENKGE